MRKTFVAAVVAASLIGGVALAQDRSPGSVEDRLERIERAIARLEERVTDRGERGVMDGCRDMMGGGMMGGRESRRGGSPNNQWLEPR